MMEFLRQWLLGVVSCAFLVGVLDQLTPEGAMRQIARFAGGLALLLSMLRPLGAAELSALTPELDAYALARTELEKQYALVRDQSLAAVIAERTGAYIEDKAHALGLEITAEVTLREENGTFVPDRAVLTGAENGELAALLARELGIPREKQEWRAAECAADG